MGELTAELLTSYKAKVSELEGKVTELQNGEAERKLLEEINTLKNEVYRLREFIVSLEQDKKLYVDILRFIMEKT